MVNHVKAYLIFVPKKPKSLVLLFQKTEKVSPQRSMGYLSEQGVSIQGNIDS